VSERYGRPELRGGPANLSRNRPLLWLFIGEGMASIAFWAYLPISFTEATYRFSATPSQMFFMLASFSLPFVLLNTIQGILVDRWSPKWLILCGYLALITAIPIARAASSLLWLYASTFMVGAADAAIQPARSALTGMLVERSALVRANGILSSALYGALVIGPLAGGYLQGAYDNDTALAGAFVVSLVSLPFFLLLPDIRQRGDRPAFSVGDLRAGFATSIRQPELRTLLLLGAVMFCSINVLFSLEPLFVKGALGLGEGALSYLWSANGVGSVIGALVLATVRRGESRELAFTASALVIAGCGLLVYVIVGTFPSALAGNALAGAGFSVYLASGLALIQRVSPEDERGRVTSVFATLQEGVALSSSLLFGALGIAATLVRPMMIAAGALLSAAGSVGLRRAARIRARPRIALPESDDDAPAA
jgi:predicted MFS family arabinose efflux permease